VTRALRICVLGAIWVLAPACKTVAAGQDRPAVLSEPVAKGRAEVASSVSAALGGVPVTLADDALTRESTLVLERARRRDPNGLLIQGRERGMPERFDLVKNGSDCLLVHQRTGKRIALHEVACSAI
jgi:hypothetical protein